LKNYHGDWKGEFAKGVCKVSALILEAIASYGFWIWHAFFRCPGSPNDLNVLDRSLVFQQLYEGWPPKCEYMLNGHKYNIGYFLSNVIYPK